MLHHTRAAVLLAVAASAVAMPHVPASAAVTTLGKVQSFTCKGAVCTLVANTASAAPLPRCDAAHNVVCAPEGQPEEAAAPLAPTTVTARVVFYTPQIVRYWLAIDGNFSDVQMVGDNPWHDPIIGQPKDVTLSAAEDKGAYWEVATQGDGVVVRMQKDPATLSVVSGGRAVMAESSPLAWNSTTVWQSLAMDKSQQDAGLSKEYFFGGGMQNGAPPASHAHTHAHTHAPSSACVFRTRPVAFPWRARSRTARADGTGP